MCHMLVYQSRPLYKSSLGVNIIHQVKVASFLFIFINGMSNLDRSGQGGTLL